MATVAELLSRGWTRSLIATFLGEPEDMRRGWGGKGGRPARLYNLERVRKVESTIDFLRSKRAANQKSDLARSARHMKQAEVLQFAGSLSLQLAPEPFDVLVDRARLDVALDRPGQSASRLDALALDRAVALLLQSFTNARDTLNVYTGHPGIQAARVLLHNRELDTIAAAYPQLRVACDRRRLPDASSPTRVAA